MTQSNVLEFKIVTTGTGLMFVSDAAKDFVVSIPNGEGSGSLLNVVGPALKVYFELSGRKLTGIFAEVTTLRPASQEPRFLVQYAPA